MMTTAPMAAPAMMMTQMRALTRLGMATVWTEVAVRVGSLVPLPAQAALTCVGRWAALKCVGRWAALTCVGR